MAPLESVWISLTSFADEQKAQWNRGFLAIGGWRQTSTSEVISNFDGPGPASLLSVKPFHLFLRRSSRGKGAVAVHGDRSNAGGQGRDGFTTVWPANVQGARRDWHCEDRYRAVA